MITSDIVFSPTQNVHGLLFYTSHFNSSVIPYHVCLAVNYTPPGNLVHHSYSCSQESMEADSAILTSHSHFRFSPVSSRQGHYRQYTKNFRVLSVFRVMGPTLKF